MERYAEKAAAALGKVLGSPTSAQDLEIPPDRKMGDFAFPCFRLAKEKRKAPPQIAKDMAAELQKQNLHGLSVAAVGPYVNFTAPADAPTTLLKDILQGDGDGGYANLKQNSETWVFEYSSPNVAKPFLIGHLRSTVLGAALARMASRRGFKTISINHLGDWGTQYGKLAVAFQRYGSSLPSQPSIDDLVKIYVRFHDEAEKDPTLEEEARKTFRKLEEGDSETLQFWKKCVEISIQEFDRVYDRLGVHFDYVWGESHYRDQLPALIDGLKKTLAEESEGAWIVPLSTQDDSPPLILQKKDGATIYATRDLAAAIYRHEQFKFNRMTYVVGAEQKLHFKQIFDVLKQMGHSWSDACEHVSFGLYRFKGGKMSTRKGHYMTLQEVLDETKGAVKKLIADRKDEISEEDAEAVALGAIVFQDLSTDPVRDVQFDLERVVAFEGDTGPYLQYAHTRCLSILRKAGGVPQFSEKAVAKLQHEAEVQLAKTLGRLGYHLDRSLRTRKPTQLAHYLLGVTKDFGFFYKECPVLSAEEELKNGRLMLVEATRRILSIGLEMLGIPKPSKM